MADITKCRTVSCPIKEECYRYTAPDDNKWQSYADFTPLCVGVEGFPYFWNNGAKHNEEHA